MQKSNNKQRELVTEAIKNPTFATTVSQLDNSLNQEVSAKIWFFRNTETGAVWSLCIQDDELLVNVPNHSFQISPLSLNKFRPVNTLVDLDIEFEQPAQNKKMLMHLYAKGIKRATFEAI